MTLDAHLHLQTINDPQTLEAIFKGDSQKSAGPFFCNAITPDDWPVIETLSQAHDSIVPFYGVHPWHVDQAEEDWEARLEKYLQDQVSGVGEIGLDRSRDKVGIAKQIEIFHRQLELAIKLSKPCAIHCVRAWGELLEILRTKIIAGRLRMMIHSFRSSPEVLRELISLGMYISISWKGVRYLSEEMAQMVQAVPDDRLLVETDFPYTEPGTVGVDISAGRYFACLDETYEIVARARRTDTDDVKKMVLENGKIFLYGTSHR